MKKIGPIVLVLIVSFFGLLTLFLTTSIIFDLFGIREREGNFLMFIVWVNFISGILYLFSAYGIAKKKSWSVSLLGLSAVVLISALIGLFSHISSGGIFEEKTVKGMVFRCILTISFTVFAFTLTKRKKDDQSN